MPLMEPVVRRVLLVGRSGRLQEVSPVGLEDTGWLAGPQLAYMPGIPGPYLRGQAWVS